MRSRIRQEAANASRTTPTGSVSQYPHVRRNPETFVLITGNDCHRHPGKIDPRMGEQGLGGKFPRGHMFLEDTALMMNVSGVFGQPDTDNGSFLSERYLLSEWIRN